MLHIIKKHFTLYHYFSSIYKLWIKDVIGLDNIPPDGPAIIVSNHLSYFDFLILGSLRLRNLAFLAASRIKTTPVINFFTRWHTVVYIDREQPAMSVFRNLLNLLHNRKIVVIYPEGTRSRTGKMLFPKRGFVELAVKNNIPVIPVAMKGTYDILPPHKRLPRFRRCSVAVGGRFYIAPHNPDFRDIFYENGSLGEFRSLSAEQMDRIAVRIMDKIRVMADEQWDDSAVADVRRVSSLPLDVVCT